MAIKAEISQCCLILFQFEKLLILLHCSYKNLLKSLIMLEAERMSSVKVRIMILPLCLPSLLFTFIFLH